VGNIIGAIIFWSLASCVLLTALSWFLPARMTLPERARSIAVVGAFSALLYYSAGGPWYVAVPLVALFSSALLVIVIPRALMRVERHDRG
jgi:hypothetical protein